MSWLFRWSSTSRRWAVAGGVFALLVAGWAWIVGITAGGLDPYEVCELHRAAGETPELVIQHDLPPVELTCVFRDGSTIALTPDWVNSTFFLMTVLAVILLVTAYVNVLIDAWQRPHPIGETE